MIGENTWTNFGQVDDEDALEINAAWAELKNLRKLADAERAYLRHSALVVHKDFPTLISADIFNALTSTYRGIV